MNCAREAMKETALDAAFFKQLPNVFQSVDSVLNGLSRKAIHQIRMDQNSSVAEAASDSGHLFHRNAFFHQCQKTIRRNFQSSGNRNAATSAKQLTEIRSK